MNTQRLLALLACALLTLTASAQQMPQDNWRYDGLQFGSPTTGNSLSSIATGSGGVYAGEYNGGGYPTNILQFTEHGVFVRRFSATLNTISGIACDSSGNVYVFDSGDSKVKVFDQNGVFVRQWGTVGSGDGQFGAGPYGYLQMIAVDKNSQVYVCDPGNTRVQVFDSNGNFLRKWGQQGNLPGQFSANRPTAVFVSKNGSVYTDLKIFDNTGNYQ